jgi:UDP-GlcNAc3NAcA epimerase
MKLLTIVGARPQFVKAAALSRVMKSFPGLTEIIVHTGQHFDHNMSDIFFEEMEIPRPHYNLNINGLSHGAMTGQMLEGIEKIILAEQPDFLLVYGDTNSTLAGALAAKKLHVKVIHVEAGLRSFNMAMPEEVNRILTDRISDILFCPTETAVDNLHKEGYKALDSEIVLSGDVMQDAALYYKEKSDKNSTVLFSHQLRKNDFVLATIHRAENTDDEIRLKAIVKALNEINKTLPVVVPLHPRTAKILKDRKIEVGFTIIAPVGYFDMLQLISNSRLVLTDSGGLQKEAYFFNKYCITFRDETEWVELVKHGYNQVVGASTEKILSAFTSLVDKDFVKTTELYGGGNASFNICEKIAAVSKDFKLL